MKYKVTHSTTYHYTELVPVCHNRVHLTPRDSLHQTCRQHRLIVKPAPATSGRRIDYFGNHLTYFSIREGHRKLAVTSMSRVDVRPIVPREPRDSPPWESVAEGLRRDLSPQGLEAFQFAFDSPHIRSAPDLAAYASPSLSPGRPLLEGVLELMGRIHRDFKYDADATHVHTTLEEVLRIRRGVCQDLAHVQIGCLRSLGLAARYVSGYLLTAAPPGRPRLVGADASHAWLSVYCGGLGWIDFDPTNDLLPSEQHITLAWGRDYGDVCPIQGLFVGGGKHTMHVAVDVTPDDVAVGSPNVQ